MESSETLKACCADLYGSEAARLLLGDSFHPGGTALTERLGRLLQLGQGSRVLDVASGRGTSAFHLAKVFGCHVVGSDLSQANIEAAMQLAQETGMDALVSFELGDAEALPYDASFDTVICECAFCTLGDKAGAARGMARAVREGGRLGFSDLIRTGALPPELEGLLAWVACLADARPPLEYCDLLEAAGFRIGEIEDHRGGFSRVVATLSGWSKSSCLFSASAGVFQPSVLRGRLLRAAATASSSAAVCLARSVPLGKYWRNMPLVFSFVPRCRGLWGSQK